MRAEIRSSRELGMRKGSGCGGMVGGNGGSVDGVGRQGRAAERSGSTVLRKLVKTSDRSDGSLNGRSSLG